MLALRVDRAREQPHFVAGAASAANKKRCSSRPAELRRGEQRVMRQAGCLVEDSAVAVEHLRESVTRPAIGARPGVAQSGVSLCDERGDIGCPRTQALVERPIERRREVVVEQESGGGEYDCHRRGEDERQTDAERNPVHVPPSMRMR